VWVLAFEAALRTLPIFPEGSRFGISRVACIGKRRKESGVGVLMRPRNEKMGCRSVVGNKHGASNRNCDGKKNTALSAEELKKEKGKKEN